MKIKWNNKRFAIRFLVHAIFACLFVFFLRSLDKPNQFEYLFFNNTKYDLTVKFKESKKDPKSYIIESGATRCLSAFNYIVYKESKINVWFKDIIVLNGIDTVNINLFDLKYWEYQDNKTTGRYILTIHDEYITLE